MVKQYFVSEVLLMAEEQGLACTKWRWKPLKTYNGFTHEQRVKGWQAMHLAVKLGIIPPASSCACEICGATHPVKLQYHSEDYSKLAEHVLCSHCHKVLHQRYKYPEKWSELIKRNSTGAEWYSNLT